MPRPVLPALRAVLLALPPTLAVTACAAAGKSPAGSPVKETAPAGVAHRHTVLEAEIPANGGEAKAGEYRVGSIVEAAEPWFQGEHGERGGHGELVNREPGQGATRPSEILPMEASTGRIVTDVPVLRYGAGGAKPALSEPVTVAFTGVELKNEG